MKKKLEADLISIAHRILKLRNKSELDQLYLETKALYEKLAVLQFVETHFADAKPTIGHQEVTESLQVIFDDEAAIDTAHNDGGASADNTQDALTAPEAIAEPANTDEETEATDEEHETDPIVEAHETEAEADDVEETSDEAENVEEPETAEASEETEAQNAEETEDEAEDEPSQEAEFKPSFDLSFEKKEEEPKDTPKQISFEDFLGNYTEPVFEKVSDKKEEVPAKTPEPEAEDEETPVEEPTEEETAEQPTVEEPEGAVVPEASEEQAAETVPVEEKEETPAAEKQPEPAYEPVQPATEKPLRSFTFGLNDRIGFEKNLFGGSGEDMNRVVSQLSTFDSFDEARNFIEEMVKPDYNNWEGKDDYAQRFLDIVERKFN